MNYNINTQATTFWNFLKENTIEIPIIQRDYAQGRIGKENLRKNFLTDLKNALDSNKTMKLDFVYGSIENGKLNPLDGQQRLTTIWLLHWYIALRARELSEYNCTIFRNFTYETRISSREFCQNLCNYKHFENFNENDIVGFITKQTWFYSAWKQDPTIQSMLRMLGGTKVTNKKQKVIVDGIEELFPSECLIDDGKVNCAFKDYWEKLISNDAPIVFYHLPLKDFGLSDDLYIKMNARGKQLTDFENFKADLIGFIIRESESDQSEWENLLNPTEGFPIKLDTDWTDIFWKNKSKDNRIDEIYFAFFNRYFLQELVCAKKDDKTTDLYSADDLEKNNGLFRHLYGEKGDDSRLKYSGLDKYLFSDDKDILHSLFTSFRDTLNNFIGTCCLKTYFPTWVDSKFEFIPSYEETGNITTLSQKERVVFLAVCRYFEKGNFNSVLFKQWIRVVWNIVENSGIETISAMIGAMRLINELSVHSHDIYKFLSDPQPPIISKFAQEQVLEEIAKAKQILSDDKNLRTYYGSCTKADGSNYQTWEEFIIDAEKYAFFKGAIRFLFTDSEGNTNWNYFDTKWENAKKYFDKDGVSKDYQVSAKLLRALLSRINVSDQWFGNHKEFWRTSLLNSDYQSAIHDLLTINELKIKEECNKDWIKDNDLLDKLLERHDRWHILNKWRGFPVLTTYVQRRKDATSEDQIVVLDDLRNELLKDNNFEIEAKTKVGKTTYLYGWNINFKYNNCFFKWCKPNEEEPHVYLMDDEKLPNPDKCTGEDNYYCFRVTEDMESNSTKFKEKLNELIRQSEGTS